MPLLDSRWLQCPWCGERFELIVDASGGDADYTEDCPVCCRPIALHLRDDGEDFQLDGERE